MTTVNIADLKNNLSKYLSKVKAGEEVLVKDRNIPIAKIIPLSVADDEDSELLMLASEGKIKLANDDSPFDEDFFKAKLPRVSVDVVAMLREERDER
jgi:prevent-host-death family protein